MLQDEEGNVIENKNSLKTMIVFYFEKLYSEDTMLVGVGIFKFFSHISLLKMLTS